MPIPVSSPPRDARPALRVLPAPPLDAPPPAPDAAGASVLAAIDGQLALPLDWQLPNGIPAAPPVPRHLRLLPAAEEPAGLPGLPPAAPWAGRLATAVLEVAAGERPPGQLLRWTTPGIYNDLARRYTVAARHPAGRPRRPQCRQVRSVRASQVRPGVVEAAAVISGATRSRAVALRLEAMKGRWVATAVEIG